MSPDALPDPQATTDVVLLAGRYQVLDKLGEGGMGAVFRARDTKLDRAVAVKMLPQGSTPDGDAVARFQREAKALARLTHPGIIQAHDSGEEAGRPFLIMELVEGRSLAALLRDQGRVGPPRAADFAYQAALALHHAHKSGLVHRDVKPSNLLLSSEGRVRLLDLGLARFLQDQIGEAVLTRTGTGMGTPDYCPPEQFRDARHADVRSDVYALGCTLYHLISGRVPFPGSSFSEKVEAHETKDPTPLEELCPEVPAGLALTVRRMMAKRPADRFQTMAEVAEALMPHVAGSSSAFPQIRKTATWDGSRLATMPAMPRRRAPWLVAGLAAALLLAAIGVAGLATDWFRRGDALVAQATDMTTTANEPGDTGPTKPHPDPKNEEPLDPNVLTVAQKPGAARFQTIGAAIQAVKPGQTVLVLDDAVYTERLNLAQASSFQNVTLTAPRHATLAIPSGTRIGVQISSVPGLVLRGFRIRADGPVGGLVVVTGQTPGVTLEDLDLQVSAGTGMGVSVEEVHLNAALPPLTVRGCRFQGGEPALQVAGTIGAIQSIVVEGNSFAGMIRGMLIRGEVGRVCVVANRFFGASDSAIQLGPLGEKTDTLLVANNSFLDCTTALRLADTAPKGSNVRLSGNLILGSPRPDILFVSWTGRPDDPGKAGDGRSVGKAWRIDHNWREVKLPPSSNPDTAAWVPPAPKNGDVRQDEIKGVNRDSKAVNFLRPDSNSKPANDGAGNEDPLLPRYVGALPPDGTDPWDWDRTWRMPKESQLLTVSKEPSGGGKYRTITDALKDARPWTTIRVLDTATYAEAFNLTDRKKYEGLTLEAVRGATLHLGDGVQRLVAITDVPHVRVTGFTFTEESSVRDITRAFVSATGTVPGVTLSRLTLTPQGVLYGVVLQNAVATPGEPLRIEHCTIKPLGPLSNDGISVVGSLEQAPAGGICIRSNRIFNCQRGINLHGSLSDIQVVGNLLVNARTANIQIEDLTPLSHGLLVANNTAFGGQNGFRVWNNAPSKDPTAGQVEVVNNLFFAAAHSDVTYVLDPGKGQEQTPGDGQGLLKLWRFHHNRRDYSGTEANFALPPGADEVRLKRDELLSSTDADLDRVRPGKDSPLATQGAGTKDGSLPGYIGALPPEGVLPWDWDRTWRARVKQTATGSK